MNADIIQLFVSTFVTIALGYTASKIATSKKISIVGAIGTIFILAIICSIGLYFYNCWSNNYFEKKGLIGVWVESYDTKDGINKNYGIGYFEVNSFSGEVSFYGNAYDEKGIDVGNWQSTSSRLKNGKFSYFYTGKSKNEEPKNKSREGMGEIDFNHPNGGIYNSGTGYYMASFVDTIPRWFSINKLTNENEILMAKENPIGFIKKYHLKKEN